MKNSYYEKNRDIPGIYIEEATNTYAFPHFHQSLEMLYVLEGTFHLIVNGKKYSPKAHEMIFIPPNFSHSISNAKSKSITLTIPPNFLHYYKQIMMNNFFPFILDDVKYNEKNILPLFRNIQEIHKRETPFKINATIYELFSRIYLHYPLVDIPQNKDSQLVISLIEYLNLHFQDEITLDSLCKEFNYSKYYFSRLFNQYFNCTYKYYLNSLRVNYVIENYHLHEHSLLNLIYIAGFRSTTTFYRHFKLLFGLSPQEYFNQRN